jgi:hypothetical protein
MYVDAPGVQSPGLLGIGGYYFRDRAVVIEDATESTEVRGVEFALELALLEPELELSLDRDFRSRKSQSLMNCLFFVSHKPR